MREGWEIKTIGEIAEITDYVANGSFATLRENVSYLNDKGYAILVRLADYTNNFDAKKYVYIDEHAYNFLAKSKLHGGEIIMSNVGSIGKCFICPDLGMPMSLAPNSIVIKTANNRFFHYVCQSNHFQKEIEKISSKTALPKFNKTSFKTIEIPVPILPEQQKIVEELDCLSNMIELKKKQLETYDKLAQAIFYDMFGDPITNEKGWKERSLTDVCTNLFAGGDVPKGDYSETKTEQHSIPILSNGVGDKALYGYTSKPRVNEVSLTISGRGTIGYCEVRTTPFLPVVRLIVATPNTDIILPITLKFIVDALKLKGTGGTIPQLTIPMIKNKKVFLPPIGIQQEFASKIEALEKQKELIKQSLSETEILFNSRMDYYFN